MSLNQLRNRFVLGCVLAGLAACSESTGPGVTPGTVTVNAAATAVGVRQDESESMVVRVNRGGYDGRVEFVAEGAPPGVLIWFEPARISAGVDSVIMRITAGVPSPAGTYPITVRARGVEPGAAESSTTVNLTVIPAIVVSVTPNPVGFHPGDQQQLSASVSNATNTAVTWTSSNNAVATVSSTGVITAVGRGTATITARSVQNTTRTGTTTVNVLSARLIPGTPLTGLANPAARGADLWWIVDVPAGQSQLRVTIAGGTGDVDLYIYTGYISGLTCSSFNDGNDELCVINNPAAGRYFVRLNTWDPWAGATLAATIVP
jgi:hypothetical protein